MPQDFFFKPCKIFCHNCHKIMWNIFRQSLKTSCHKCHKIFFQTSENLLSQLPQDHVKYFQAKLKSHCHKCHKIFFKALKTSCHKCHKIFFSNLWKSLVTIATRPCEIFSGKAEKSLSQMPQDFFSKLSKALVTIVTRPFLANLIKPVLRSRAPNPAGGNHRVWMYAGFFYVFQSSGRFIEVWLG